MPAFPLISDADLARARNDLPFRRHVLASQLQALIGALAVLQTTAETAEPGLADQLREGADLVVKLSDILKQLAALGAEPPTAAGDP